MLETVGPFRIVTEAGLPRDGDDQARFAADVRSLSDQRLLERATVCIHRRPMRVLVLTDAGKSLLEARSHSTREPRQTYHAGLVKPRELAHDAALTQQLLLSSQPHPSASSSPRRDEGKCDQAISGNTSNQNGAR
jgi:hypothetical protein